MYTYNIFDDVIRLQDVIDGFFREIPASRGRREYPYVEMHEGKDELEIRALLPGVNASDIDIQLVDNSLIIEGEKKSDYAEKPYVRKERGFGRFSKSIKLPYRVETDKIDAKLSKGLLHVRLRRSEESKPRKIQIQ